jgi:hypothetical protein
VFQGVFNSIVLSAIFDIRDAAVQCQAEERYGEKRHRNLVRARSCGVGQDPELAIKRDVERSEQRYGEERGSDGEPSRVQSLKRGRPQLDDSLNDGNMA